MLMNAFGILDIKPEMSELINVKLITPKPKTAKSLLKNNVSSKSDIRLSRTDDESLSMSPPRNRVANLNSGPTNIEQD